MTERNLDRDLRDLFEHGPGTAPAATVQQALARLATVDQRRPRVGWLDRQAWPPRPRSVSDPAVHRVVRLVAVAALLLALGAVIAVGARLLERPPSVTVDSGATLDVVLRSPSAQLWPDGRVLIRATEGTMRLYDPATGASEQLAFGPDFPSPMVDVMANGQVMLRQRQESVDGPRPDVMGLHDPATGVTRTVGELPQRWFGAATLPLRDGRVLISGGVVFPHDVALPCSPAVCEGVQTPAPTPTNDMSEGAKDLVVLFDASTGISTEVGHLRVARFNHAMLELEDGRVLIVGGGDYGASPLGEAVDVELYDLASHASTIVGSIGPRSWPISLPPVQLADGRVLIPGRQVLELPCGMPTSSGGKPALPDAHAVYRQQTHVFDPAANVLTEGPVLPHFYGAENIVPLQDGRALVFGGYTVTPGGCGSDEGVYTKPWLGVIDLARNTVYESYNPLTGVATIDLDVAQRYAAAVRLRDGRVLLVGDDDSRSKKNPIDIVTIR